ncbi:similar to Saccharomyces cerevisiae YGR068C ART5 Protein proposed to regulate the endocytosis of plasma membrane proteins by recruiting the ubiquitin ligase Rsp5p to its target in the plasma membrane [Maudiozyma saulgeensis]|uniref:Similar to Saccharomyces cerevisiae YGR068C ART5 Protein proposed to regulate the endocytosis of plasma membrane proteins by recruiting the ubiquitin ligase Rsp5p to its target in the plasma membrane n=1 Tax=Maudiozyma saulgeensis TaxID=1789683 RepID=A0A1X7QZ97_9SACH|nr:similar to Saccharomyces cerevisiae YGR068C ART5 Protein proposed to regulate the endocytosis of plasma membrane proteins by recruiting the ubiquitin ligase Rsp5p to its target in the plasma membrane [Kazachstania saulgeensis]
MQIFSLNSKKKSPKKIATSSSRQSDDLQNNNNNILNSTKKDQKPIISYYDIRVDSPYKDLILIQGTPLESTPISLSGKLIFSLNEDTEVKRIKLRLTGRFKLEFLQMSRKKGTGGMTSIVKEQQTLIECEWDNLLRSSKGHITVNNISGYNISGNNNNNNNNNSNSDRSNENISDTNYNNDSGNDNNSGSSTPIEIDHQNKKANKKFRISGKQGKRTTQMLELPEDGYSGTPYPDLNNDNKKYTFLLRRGNYELPFVIQLPSDIPETVEGLQSSSILYSMEGVIERRKKTNLMMLNETDKRNLNAILSASSSIISSGYDSSAFNQSLNLGSKIFTKYKYLRVLRTLSTDNLAMQEEMSVGNTLIDKLQYEIKIPSRAIPIGGRTPIQIKIFPFQKNYMLNKISISLIQMYSMKDSDNQVYEDEVVVNRQSMVEFGDLVEQGTNRLIDKFELFSEIQLPDDLRRVTQDCDIKNDYIHVHHKLMFHIILKRTLPGENTPKNLEIKANIPILLFVSPQLPMKGRLVLFDQITGKIHFRAGKLVQLFSPINNNNNITNLNNLHLGTQQELNYNWFGDQLGYNTLNINAINNNGNSVPPPNYQERTNDQLIQQLEGILPTTDLLNSSMTISGSAANAVNDSGNFHITNITTSEQQQQQQQQPPSIQNGNSNDNITHSNETTEIYEQPPPLLSQWSDQSDTIPEYSETP